MTQDTPILEIIEPDLAGDLGSRRGLFAKAALALGAAASVPTVLAAVATEAYGQAPQRVVEVLNFALTLEYLEDEFYQRGLAAPGLIPGRFRQVFRQVGQHETAHVATLRGALGPAAVAKPRFDFTARGRYRDVFSNFATFALLSQTFEDLGVAAYKGQAPALMGTGATLTTALQIHSVEARHAAEIRRVRGVRAWTGPYDNPMSRAQVLRAAAPFIVA